jgi:succinate dehydrogenase hydrophobic anchor subunit
MNGEEGIFCDEESKLRMMERVLRVRMTPLVVIFFCFLLPQLCMNSASGNYAVAAFMGGLMAVYLLVFLISARGYFKMKNGRR